LYELSQPGGQLVQCFALSKRCPGLALEFHTVGKADEPMLYVERQQHFAAMRRVLHGVEGARVVLANASKH
jgi:hypothetical protein